MRYVSPTREEGGKEEIEGCVILCVTLKLERDANFQIFKIQNRRVVKIRHPIH